MNATQERRAAGERGFTLVEALAAIVMLSFGLAAVSNLLLVASSSNQVANQGTAAVTSATRVMDLIKNGSYGALAPSTTSIDIEAPGSVPATPACQDAAIPDGHCTDDVRGVGRIHVHWTITPDAADARLLMIRVRAEGTGPLTRARSRAEFTAFRACTFSVPDGICPKAVAGP
jgi:type II secretory pathway pseudopilin PulG